jgi:hypothetical protein
MLQTNTKRLPKFCQGECFGKVAWTIPIFLKELFMRIRYVDNIVFC